MFDGDARGVKISADRFRSLIEELKNDWSGKGLELVNVSNGWRFQSRPEMKPISGKTASGKTSPLQQGDDGNAGDHRL